MAAPYLDGMVMEILRPALTPAKVFTIEVVDKATQVPCVVARAVNGGREVDPRFPCITAPVQIDSYALTRPAAQALAETAKDALVLAWQGRAVTTHGSLTNVTTIAPAVERRADGQLDGFYRWSATYSLTAVE